MAEELRLLRSLDHPRWAEQPPGFDRARATQRARAFAADLEARLGRRSLLETGSEIQDASPGAPVDPMLAAGAAGAAGGPPGREFRGGFR